MKGGLPLLRVEGSPYDVGLGQGVDARELVAQNVLTYLRRFAQEGGIDHAEIRKRAAAYRQVIETVNPAYAREMAGIADGARQDPLDIVAINVRYEILYTEFVRKALQQTGTGAPNVSGCTSFALLPPQTENGHLLMGENWDWIPDIEGIVVHARREGQPESLAFTEAGIAGAKIGLNRAGIGLAINGLVTDQDSWSRLLKPFHVRTWEILGSRTLDEAVDAVVGAKRACSANFLIGKADGGTAQVVDVETSPEAECRFTPSEGFLVHTNHFLEPDSIGLVQPLGEELASTFHRLSRFGDLVRGRLRQGEKIGIDDLRTFLADHKGELNSICRHASLVKPEHERYATVVSAILDVDARELRIAPGPPCETEYRLFSLPA